VHLRGLGVIDPLPGQRGELLADSRRRQPGELDLLGNRLAQQFREVSRVLGLGVACGHHQQDPLARQCPGEVPDQQDRRPVGPVRVVEDDQQGPLAARVSQQSGDRVELAEPLLPAPVGHRGRRGAEHVRSQDGEVGREAAPRRERGEVDAVRQRP
jgi:hypothetical protein